MRTLIALGLAYWYINTAGMPAGESGGVPPAQVAQAVTKQVIAATPTPEEMGQYVRALLPPPEVVARKVHEAMPSPEMVTAQVRTTLNQMEAGNGQQ